MFFVLGSRNSSNSVRLVEMAQQSGCKSSELIHSESIIPFDKIEKCTTIGEWKNGKLDGHATSTWGSFKQKGEWRYGKAWNTKEYITTRENVITSKTINGISKSWNTYRYGIDKKIEGEWVNGVFHKIVKNSNGKCLRLDGREVRCVSR